MTQDRRAARARDVGVSARPGAETTETTPDGPTARLEQGASVARFGPALRDRRRAAGLSQRALAARTGLDFSYISKVENGRVPPPAADTIVAICRVLDTSPEDLLALTGKIPSAVQQTLSTNTMAQQFLRAAQQMALTDQEWAQLLQALHRLRAER